MMYRRAQSDTGLMKMTLALPCVRCGKKITVTEQFSGRKIRCQACGQVQRIPIFPTPNRPANGETPPVFDVYPLAPVSPTTTSAVMPETRERQLTAPHQSHITDWHRLVHASISESSLLELESLGLIALSVADVLVTYVLLRRGPAFYESNPVAHWFFVRWNIAGMAVFKFGAMGLVVVIGEIVERHRPRWGRRLLLVSCLATAAVVWYGLRLLFGYGDNGAPLY